MNLRNEVNIMHQDFAQNKTISHSFLCNVIVEIINLALHWLGFFMYFKWLGGVNLPPVLNLQKDATKLKLIP